MMKKTGVVIGVILAALSLGNAAHAACTIKTTIKNSKAGAKAQVRLVDIDGEVQMKYSCRTSHSCIGNRPEWIPLSFALQRNYVTVSDLGFGGTKRNWKLDRGHYKEKPVKISVKAGRKDLKLYKVKLRVQWRDKRPKWHGFFTDVKKGAWSPVMDCTGSKKTDLYIK